MPVDYRELVGIVGCSGPNQRCDESGLSKTASTGDQNSRFAPADYARMDEGPAGACFGHLKGNDGTEALQKVMPVTALEEQPPIPVKPIRSLSGCRGVTAMDK
jgi:hypothetical protein